MKLLTPVNVMLLAVLSTAGCTSSSSIDLTAKEHAALGMQHAELFPGLTNLCDIEAPFRVAGQRNKKNADKKRSTNKKRKQRAPIAPTKVFDNLYFVGNGGVSSWVIETSDGLIVIDALNSDNQAKQYIEKGLITLGLDPNNIKYLIMTHEHGDHYGGHTYLTESYDPRLVMSDIAWTRLEKNQLTISSPSWGEKPKRDISIDKQGLIKLGQTQVDIFQTPGHTPGTISLIFPVFDNGKKHMVSLWGGTGLNYGPIEERILSYSQSAKDFKTSAVEAGVDVFLSNHPARDGSKGKLKALSNRTATENHPFVLGKDKAVGVYDLLENCTYAQALRVKNGDY